MILRWVRFVRAAYKPSIMLPFMISWAIGLTALFAGVTGSVTSWRPDAELLITTVTLVVFMMLMRALDDIRDLDYDRQMNPGRPLPSGMVKLSDLVTMLAFGSALLLLLNAGRGVVLLTLIALMAYTGLVVALEMVANWPDGDRLGLQLMVNVPIQLWMNVYVYTGFLREEHLSPSVEGFVVVVAVTIAALCLELGRKATRRPRPGERTYVTVLGPSGTSFAAFASAIVATGIVLVLLGPWEAGNAWGWLVLAPLAMPAVAVAKFAGGAIRWPIPLTMYYIPAMYGSFLAAAWFTKGTFA